MPWNIQPPPQLGTTSASRTISNAVASLRLLCGVDSANKGRVLRTDTAGHLVINIASGLGVLQKEWKFWIAGTLAVTNGLIRFYNLTGATLSFQKVHLSVGTAPTGANIICDVNRGTGASEATIFASGDRPTIVAGNKTGESVTFATVNLADGYYLTFDIDQVGSIVAGTDLTFTVLLG
jgi:hypothetical protein